MPTYNKVSDTAIEVTTPTTSILTLDVLAQRRADLVSQQNAITAQIAEIDSQEASFRALGVVTQAEYDAAHPVDIATN